MKKTSLARRGGRGRRPRRLRRRRRLVCAVRSGPTSRCRRAPAQSTNGFIAYLQALVASSADTLEPVDTSSGHCRRPTTTSEPTTVD